MSCTMSITMLMTKSDETLLQSLSHYRGSVIQEHICSQCHSQNSGTEIMNDTYFVNNMLSTVL